MPARPDPRCRLILAHLVYAPGGLGFGAEAPAGDEGAGEGGVREKIAIA